MTYDVELGIREIAKARARGGALTTETARLAEHVVAGFRRDFGDELDMETCGKALVIAASAVIPLCHDEIPGVVLANLIGLAGESLVRGARNG